MGCCNKDKKCQDEEQQTKKEIPWFRMFLGTLMLLVFLFWERQVFLVQFWSQLADRQAAIFTVDERGVQKGPHLMQP